MAVDVKWLCLLVTTLAGRLNTSINHNNYICDTMQNINTRPKAHQSLGWSLVQILSENQISLDDPKRLK